MSIKENFKNDKTLTTITYFLLGIGLICLVWVIYSTVKKKMEDKTFGNMSCVKSTVEVKADDEHMDGIIAKDQSVKLLTNYYNCNKVALNELVYFRFSEQIPPVIRWVRGVPGNRYEVM